MSIRATANRLPGPATVPAPMSRAAAGFWASGVPFIWLTGGTLAICLIMIGGLLAHILMRGLGSFWPAEVAELRLKNGSVLLGEIWDRETIPGSAEEGGEDKTRLQLRVGNRDLYGVDFRWIDDSDIESITRPVDAATVERREWGNFYGRPVELRQGDEPVASGSDATWNALRVRLPEARALHARIRTIERDEIGRINFRIEKARLGLRGLELRSSASPDKRAELEREVVVGRQRYEELAHELERLYGEMRGERIVLAEAGGRTKELAVAEIVRAFRANELGFVGRVRVYGSRVWEFVSGEPRESNTEGGIFPAIFGTFLMVVLMSLAVVPFGVLAAIYLREYAVQGALVRAVRIAVNNLAGVPSIVFGVFGLGFFVYFLGGTIDQLFYPERLPTPTFGTGGILWASLTLALLTVPVVIVATEEALAAIPREVREGSLALGATQWETIRRVLLPASLPGILTGAILAMARGAGEVAPLMITGVVKLAPTLPLDGEWPFLHLERKFMHLGFHIYDVGFQSPNVEAAKPMVYTTTLLLLAVVLIVNVFAITVRNRLRRRHRQSGV